jgi:hypothetical protein
MSAILRISQTGIRTGECITSSDSGSQNKGTVIQIRGFYPPAVKYVAELNATDVRDKFNLIPFFNNMDLNERYSWLAANASSNDDLYLEAVPNLYVRFIKIEGKFLVEALKQEGIDMLLRGNPNDAEGYWNIRDVFDMFPKKPGSKSTRKTLVFRPNNWSLMTQVEEVNSYTGICINLSIPHTKEEEVSNPYGIAFGTVNKEDRAMQIIPITRLKVMGTGFAILSDKRTKENALTWNRLLELANYIRPGIDKEMEAIAPVISWFTPSLHKSLIQKVIRTKCKKVTHTETYNPDAVLLTSFSLLMLHSGAFVPNIQRFVTGMESATKRLAVSIMEDSFSERSYDLLTLYCAALLARMDKSWQPTDEQIYTWFRLACEAQRENRIYAYEWKERGDDMRGIGGWSLVGQSPPQWAPPSNYVGCFLLLTELKSFESDIQMLGCIAELNGTSREATNIDLMPEMPLIHCIDHHTYTDIALYIKPSTFRTNLLTDYERGVEDAVEQAKTPFGGIFIRVWRDCTGINPRNVNYSKWQPGEAFFEIRKAQRIIWIIKTYKPVFTSIVSDKRYRKSYKLDDGWLAGLVGPLRVKLSTGASSIVVIRCDDITELSAIREPTIHGDDKTELSDSEKEEAIARGWDLLIKGVALSDSLLPTTLPQFKGATIYYMRDVDKDGESGLASQSLLKQGSRLGPRQAGAPSGILSPAGEIEYIPFVYLGGQSYTWENASSISIDFPYNENNKIDIDTAITTTSNSVMRDADTHFNNIVERSKKSVLQRLLTYLSENGSSIEIKKISRKGIGQDYVVVPEDANVNLFLCDLCYIYPAAIVKTASGFNIKCGPLIWLLRDEIRKKLLSLSSSQRGGMPLPLKRGPWDESKEGKEVISLWNVRRDDRPMRPYQEEILKKITEKQDKGEKGHAIWLNMGLGKTKIIDEVILDMHNKRRLPTYIVYTLPPSAVASVKKELERYGLEIYEIDMRVGSSKLEPPALSNGQRRVSSSSQCLQPYKVNLLLHDHMRMGDMPDQLRENAIDMLFIIDEFHKTLNKTIRTSIALEISALCMDFIGLSGTIMNAEPGELIKWLQLLVNFEVTEKNFYVAIGALASKRAKTSVIIEQNLLNVEVPDRDYYYSLVPASLGGTANNLNFKEAMRVSREAIFKATVEQSLFYITSRYKIFVTLQNAADQARLYNELISKGVEVNAIYCITSKASIILTPEMNSPIMAVLTTISLVEGYTLTDRFIGINPFFFSNLHSREQRDARMNRIGQLSPTIRIVDIVAGIFSYAYERYKKAKKISDALKGFASEIGVDVKELSS